jgi:uncharacterized protein YkwD
VLFSLVFLLGCSQVKLDKNNINQQGEVSQTVNTDKATDMEVEEKMKLEEETSAKVEQEAKAKQQAAKPVAKPSSNVASAKQKASSQPSTKVPSNNSGSSSIQLKHPVEYKTDIENEILVLVNQERSKVGLKTLVMNETLRTMGRYKSNEMLQYEYFDHNSPNIGGLSSLAKKFGYSYTSLGENIWMSKASNASYLRQNTTAEKIMNGWMNSPGHKANILSADFGKIGIGVTLSTDGFSHATQEFSN